MWSFGFSIISMKALNTYILSILTCCNDHTGVCAGITKEVFIPSSLAIMPLLAPMQPSYVIQQIIEQTLSQRLSKLLSNPTQGQTCKFALRKLICGTYFLLPRLQVRESLLLKSGVTFNALNVLTTEGVNVSMLRQHTFYLPSFPSQSVCTEYFSACFSSATVLANKGTSSVLAQYLLY